jgi:hypothetical protein
MNSKNICHFLRRLSTSLMGDLRVHGVKVVYNCGLRDSESRDLSVREMHAGVATHPGRKNLARRALLNPC